jgi:hypothetical protein
MDLQRFHGRRVRALPIPTVDAACFACADRSKKHKANENQHASSVTRQLQTGFPRDLLDINIARAENPLTIPCVLYRIFTRSSEKLST